tara:strand:- start:394 stop:663 length:270 start_codon:yes stop_codon:yes gene_type:complete
MKDKTLSSLLSHGPFKEAAEDAYQFGMNLMFSAALEESLRLLSETQKEYDEAVKNDDQELIYQKKQELDYCMAVLQFSSIVAGVDELRE